MKSVEVPAEKPVKRKRKSSNYIDNDKMYAQMLEYIASIKQHNQLVSKLPEGQTPPPKPRVSEYIGECIMMIAQRLATKPNFANYVHREEMVGDGIENCLMYIDNFDPDKSKNPFAYFTQIIYYAFVRRIQKEKKQMYVKMKMLEKMDERGNVRRMIKDAIGTDNKNNTYAEYFNLKENDINFFEQKIRKPKVRKLKKSQLDEYFDV